VLNKNKWSRFECLRIQIKYFNPNRCIMNHDLKLDASIFQEIVIKPLYIQMCLDFPELSRDRSFKANLGLDFHRESEFEEMVQLTNFTKRSEFIKGLGELKVKAGEEEKAYFDNDFLIQRFLGMNPDQIKMNQKYKEKEAKAAEKTEGWSGR